MFNDPDKTPVYPRNRKGVPKSKITPSVPDMTPWVEELSEKHMTDPEEREPQKKTTTWLGVPPSALIAILTMLLLLASTVAWAVVRVENLVADNGELVAYTRALENDLHETDNLLKQVQRERREVQDQLVILRDQQQKDNDEMTRLQNRISQLVEEEGLLRRRYARIVDQLEGRIASQGREISSQRQEIASLRGQIASQRQEIASLREEVGRYRVAHTNGVREGIAAAQPSNRDLPGSP